VSPTSAAWALLHCMHLISCFTESASTADIRTRSPRSQTQPPSVQAHGISTQSHCAAQGNITESHSTAKCLLTWPPIMCRTPKGT
jgi:hypothetical protein